VLLWLSKPAPKPRFFCKTELKLWFYASVLTVRFWNGAALVSWTLTACKSSHPLVLPAGVIVRIKGGILSTPTAARDDCGLISADSIYDTKLLTLQTTDDFLTPAALMTCTALAHAARACSCMVCFSAGYILPDLRKLTLYALNAALIHGRSASAAVSRHQVCVRVRRKSCRSESAVDRDHCPHNTAIGLPLLRTQR